MNLIKKISFILSLIACFNYGLIAIFNYDLLKHLLVDYPVILKLIYFLFGFSGFINLLKEK